MPDTALIERLKDFIENEGKSCSIDIAGITPEYVCRMWGASVAIEEIERAMEKVRKDRSFEEM